MMCLGLYAYAQAAVTVLFSVVK